VNEERTGKCLRQVEHIRGHLWHRYSITVNQFMVATVNFQSDDFNFTQRNPWFSSFLVSSIPLSMKSWPDRNHKFWNIVSSERYILHIQVLLECWYILIESSEWENWNHLFCRKVSFLTDPRCRFRGVGQGMKQTYLYLWYTLFQAQWDRCDQQNHQT
jgi:hypothetical protein